MGKRAAYNRWPQEKIDEVCKLYLQGKRVQDIAEICDVNFITLKKYLAEWKKTGVLPPGIRPNREIKKHEFKNPPQRKAPQHTDETISLFRNPRGYATFMPGRSKIPQNDTPVRCTREVASKCAFGAGDFQANKCDFCLITGESRKCSWKECTHFLKVTKEQKRYVSIYSMKGSMDRIL